MGNVKPEGRPRCSFGTGPADCADLAEDLELAKSIRTVQHASSPQGFADSSAYMHSNGPRFQAYGLWVWGVWYVSMFWGWSERVIQTSKLRLPTLVKIKPKYFKIQRTSCQIYSKLIWIHPKIPLGHFRRLVTDAPGRSGLSICCSASRSKMSCQGRFGVPVWSHDQSKKQRKQSCNSAPKHENHIFPMCKIMNIKHNIKHKGFARLTNNL